MSGDDNKTRAAPPAVSGKDSNTVAVYVWATIVLAGITITAILAILVLRPAQDNTALFATIIAFISPVLLAILALISKENHQAMNSRLDQLLLASNMNSRAEGVLEGASSPPAIAAVAAAVAAAPVAVVKTPDTTSQI